MSRIFYQSDAVTLYCSDAREVLPTLGKVDLIVTDPPYGIAWRSNRRAEAFERMAGDESQDMARDVLALAIPHLRKRRHLYVFGEIAPDGLMVASSATLIWDFSRPGLGDLNTPYGPSYDHIQFWVSAPDKANLRNGSGQLVARLRRGMVLRHPRVNAIAVRHPAEKPVSLCRELIETSSCLGETILDPFAGSGSTLVGAVLEGRKAIGIEIDERWCELAAKRLREVEAVLGQLAKLEPLAGVLPATACRQLRGDGLEVGAPGPRHQVVGRETAPIPTEGDHSAP